MFAADKIVEEELNELFITAFGRNASQRVMYETRQATKKNRIQMPGKLKILSVSTPALYIYKM